MSRAVFNTSNGVKFSLAWVLIDFSLLIKSDHLKKMYESKLKYLNALMVVPRYVRVHMYDIFCCFS